MVKNWKYPNHKHAKFLPAKISEKVPVHNISPSHYHIYFHQTVTTSKARILWLFCPCLFSTLRIYIQLTTVNLEWNKPNICLIFQLQAIHPFSSNVLQLYAWVTFLPYKSMSHSVLAWLHLQMCLVPLPWSTCTRASHKIWLLNIYSTRILIINNTVNTFFSKEIVSTFDDVSTASRAPIKKRILTQLASK